MTLRWVFAGLHLLALGMGLGAIWARSRALREPLDDAGLKRVFAADGWWGLAALLWLSTGVIRALSGLDKGPQYYATNHFFLAKMVMFLAIVALEIAPMRALIRWRLAWRRGESPDTSRAAEFANRSTVQAALVVLMVFAATAMARGLGIIP
jgi:putative membrane protein